MIRKKKYHPTSTWTIPTSKKNSRMVNLKKLKKRQRKRRWKRSRLTMLLNWNCFSWMKMTINNISTSVLSSKTRRKNRKKAKPKMLHLLTIKISRYFFLIFQFYFFGFCKILSNISDSSGRSQIFGSVYIAPLQSGPFRSQFQEDAGHGSHSCRETETQE